MQPYKKKDNCAEICCACGIGWGIFCCIAVILYGFIFYMIMSSFLSAFENLDNKK